MKKIYIGLDINAPSRTIFFKFQLPLIFKGNYLVVPDLNDADFVIIPNSNNEINKILNYRNYNYLYNNKIPVLIIKPHFERDIRIKYKNFLGKLKAIVNRFRFRESLYKIPEKLRSLNITLICDNRRIDRFFKSNGWETFYLPLTYFENKKFRELKKIKLIKSPEVVYMGEITHFLEWIENIKFLLEKKEFLKYKIRMFVFGSYSKQSIEAFIGKEKLIWDSFEFNYKKMLLKTENAVFGLIPHNKSESNYEPNLKNYLNIFSNQPNEVKIIEKYSSNSGRNHLMSSLGIPFITSPSENVLIEFNYYPFELFIESKNELYYAAKKLIDEELRQEISAKLIYEYNNNFSPKYGMIKLEKYLISKINEK